MGRLIPILVLVALTIYCVVEVAQAPAWNVRRMPKWMWAVAVICLPGVGPALWLLFGRPDSGSQPIDRYQRPPDDDQDFLNSL